MGRGERRWWENQGGGGGGGGGGEGEVGGGNRGGEGGWGNQGRGGRGERKEWKRDKGKGSSTIQYLPCFQTFKLLNPLNPIVHFWLHHTAHCAERVVSRVEQGEVVGSPVGCYVHGGC